MPRLRINCALQMTPGVLRIYGPPYCEPFDASRHLQMKNAWFHLRRMSRIVGRDGYRRLIPNQTSTAAIASVTNENTETS